MRGSKGDWVPCDRYGVSIAVAPGFIENIPLVVTRDGAGITSATSVGLIEQEGEALTERVVGTVRLQVSTGSVVIVERVRVGLRDNAGLNAFFAADFLSAADANEPFLWQRVQLVSTTSNMTSTSDFRFSQFDVRVARKLSQEQALFYSVHNTTPAGGATLTVQPFIRTYARSLN